MHKILWTLAGAVFLLGIADLFTTNAGLALGAVEANPLMRPVVGTSAAFGVKFLGAPLVLAGIVGIGRSPRATRGIKWLAVAVLAAAVVVYLHTVVSNWQLAMELAETAYCRGYEDAFMASSDIFLSWADVPGCDGLH